LNFRSVTTLQWAIGASIAVHAVLLTVRFVDPEAFNRVFEDTPLEVILVNAKTNEKPDALAKAIAQASLVGGGDAEKGRATSPLPPSPKREHANHMMWPPRHQTWYSVRDSTLNLCVRPWTLRALVGSPQTSSVCHDSEVNSRCSRVAHQ
jgi:hypothetical protein